MKDVEGSDYCVLSYYYRICMEGLKTAMKILSQDCSSLVQELNPRPPEYRTRLLTTIP